MSLLAFLPPNCQRKTSYIDYLLRVLSSQFIATTVKNLLLIDWGLVTTFPTILIAAMTGVSNEHNRNESISITASEATWIGNSSSIYLFVLSLEIINSLMTFTSTGSICYLLQPFGSLLSILITGKFSFVEKRKCFVLSIFFKNFSLVKTFFC